MECRPRPDHRPNPRRRQLGLAALAAAAFAGRGIAQLAATSARRGAEQPASALLGTHAEIAAPRSQRLACTARAAGLGGAEPRMTWHPQILAHRQQRVLAQIGPALSRRGFFLVGGTAVALHLGHRRSVDFDWFTSERFDPL